VRGTPTNAMPSKPASRRSVSRRRSVDYSMLASVGV